MICFSELFNYSVHCHSLKNIQLILVKTYMITEFPPTLLHTQVYREIHTLDVKKQHCPIILSKWCYNGHSKYPTLTICFVKTIPCCGVCKLKNATKVGHAHAYLGRDQWESWTEEVSAERDSQGRTVYL